MTGPPSTFDVERVRAGTAGTRFGAVRWVAETGSTNADVLGLAGDGAGEGLVLGADHQRAGRGRRGRSWSARPGSAVLVSVLLRPRAPAVDLVTPAVAVAAATAVEQLCGRAPGIKWPNDLVVADADGGPDRKLAGILAEAAWPAGADVASGWSAPRASTRVPVVVGLGLNVRAEGIDEGLGATAVACDQLAERGVAPDREDLVVAWLVALEHWCAALAQPTAATEPAGRDRLWDAWRARSATLGRRVRVDMGADDVTGTAVDVTAGGQLVVRTDEGYERALAVGDVTHLRAVGPLRPNEG